MNAGRCLALFAASLLSLAACGDDGPVVPGSLVVSWSLGPVATCESLHLVTMRASAMRGGEVVGTAEGDCAATAKTGSLTVAELDPGTYDVQVEGFDTDGVGTHVGMAAKRVKVSEGLEVSLEQAIVVAERPIDLLVDWDVGGKCSTAGVAKVQVQLFEAGEIQPSLDETTSCENVFTDPETDEEASGLLFQDLDGMEGVVLLLFGLDDKNQAFMKGQSDPFDLVPGVTSRQVVTLDACPGDPPDCD